MAAALAVLAGTALADWNVGDPYKMANAPQLPDLELGMNVLMTSPAILADDWRCSESGLVTDFHIWGSWLNDNKQDAIFWLKVYTDIPANASPTGYSMPGQEIWHQFFYPGQYTARLWYTHDPQSPEPFFDPARAVPGTGEHGIIGSDTQVWQYNFEIDPASGEPIFRQIVDETYWLVVQVVSPSEPLIGWKSASSHYIDAAVWGTPSPNGYIWQKLTDPRGAGDPMDLSFVITPEPATVALMGFGLAGLAARRWRRAAK
jgi:hypothetical protein